MTHQKCVILRLMYWLGTVKWRLGRGSFWGWGSLLRFAIFWISCCSLLFAVFLLEKGNKNFKKLIRFCPQGFITYNFIDILLQQILLKSNGSHFHVNF